LGEIADKTTSEREGAVCSSHNNDILTAEYEEGRNESGENCKEEFLPAFEIPNPIIHMAGRKNLEMEWNCRNMSFLTHSTVSYHFYKVGDSEFKFHRAVLKKNL
jgi:hypothetical protein